MQYYLEFKENLGIDDSLQPQPQMLCLEVVDEEMGREWYEIYKPIFEGIDHIARIHIHYHEENKPCEVIELG